METQRLIEKIVNLKENEVGSTEENVKQKLIVPLLELLGHSRDDLEFEYRTRSGRGKLDIFIKNVPQVCRVIIDTKNYSAPLDNHIEQIKEYTFEESALLAIIVNGTEIRIYSPLRGIDFERSILYSFNRQDWASESVWEILTKLLHKDSLSSKSAITEIENREREIRRALSEEERLRDNLKSKISQTEQEVAVKEEEITVLKSTMERLRSEEEAEITKIWGELDLPASVSQQNTYWNYSPPGNNSRPNTSGKMVGRVTFLDLQAENLIREDQILYFYNTRPFPEERAKVKVAINKIVYLKDNISYSTSELAKRLLQKHGFKHDEHGVQGPIYWKTEDGKFLSELNEQIRHKRGER